MTCTIGGSHIIVALLLTEPVIVPTYYITWFEQDKVFGKFSF